MAGHEFSDYDDDDPELCVAILKVPARTVTGVVVVVVVVVNANDQMGWDHHHPPAMIIMIHPSDEDTTNGRERKPIKVGGFCDHLENNNSNT